MQPFVILGASKTGTSTAVAVATAHPSVFCLFECDFTQPLSYGRNKEIPGLLPEIAESWGLNRNFAENLALVATQLADRGWNFTHVGTKVQGIKPAILPHIEDIPVLFMIRDVRHWAAKNRVLRNVMAARGSTDIVPHIIAYTHSFLDSFLISRCQRFAIDRIFVSDLSVFPQSMSAFLGLPQNAFEKWWETAESWKKTAPKNYSNWVDGHVSAFIPPMLMDTESVLAEHPFWKNFLPVFDKYFHNLEKTFSPDEVRRDQQYLTDLAKTHHMTLDSAFTRFTSFKILRVSKQPDGIFKFKATDRITESEIEEAADRWRIAGGKPNKSSDE